SGMSSAITVSAPSLRLSRTTRLTRSRVWGEGMGVERASTTGKGTSAPPASTTPLPPPRSGASGGWGGGENQHQAERGGFEPPKRLPVYAISSRVPSASRTPLRKENRRVQ